MTIDYRADAFLARSDIRWEGSEAAKRPAPDVNGANPPGGGKAGDLLDGPRATLARHDEAIERAESEVRERERVLRGGRIWMRVDAIGDDYTAGADEGAFDGMSSPEIRDAVIDLWREVAKQTG